MTQRSILTKTFCIISVWIMMVGSGYFASPLYSLPIQQTIPTPISVDCAFDPWQRTASMVIPRFNFAAVRAGKYIYALGGAGVEINHYYQSSIERAEINVDGSLSPWQILTSTMSIPRIGFTGVAIDNYIYILGGQDDQWNQLSSIERAIINTDGTLGAWQFVGSMTTERKPAIAVATNDYLYIFGGSDNNPQNWDNIERAAINVDGSLGAWQIMSAPMSIRRPGLAVIAFNNYIYALGGYTTVSSSDSVEYTKINNDGTIGPWKIVTSMNIGRGSLSAVAIDGYLYAIGGSLTGPLSSIERAPINADGTLGAWQYVNSMKIDRHSHAVLVAEGRLYALGGASDTNLPNTVEWVNTTQLGPSPDYRVSVNDGALFTNQIGVTLTISAKLGSAEMQVSNDGGFADAKWEPCVSTKEWNITQFGNYVIPRVVYTRFKDKNGNVSSTFQDDVILDVTPPSGSVTVIPATNASSRKASVTLILNANDDVSGVSDMLLSSQSDFADASWQNFQNSYIWSPNNSPTIYVKFRDNAKNISQVYSASISGSGASIYIPIIMR